jgi:transaldolase
MKFFIDTADLALLAKCADTGLVDGVTTNPTLIRQSGRNIHEVIAEICALVDGPISAEVAAMDFEGMKAEGQVLAAIHPNVTVKLPMTWDGLKACRFFADKGIKTNVTLCFSVNQAVLAAKAGATFVSPFIGRLDDQVSDGMDLIHDIVEAYVAIDAQTNILGASVRTPLHVKQCAMAGIQAITIPPALFLKLIEHPLTKSGLDTFAADWASTGQKIA